MSKLGGILAATALTLAALSAFARDNGGHMMTDGDHQKGTMGDEGMMGDDHGKGMMSGNHHDKGMMGGEGMMGQSQGEGSQGDE